MSGAAPAAARMILLLAVGATALAMGLRQSFGLFLAPMTEHHGWTASGFGFAIALQVLLNGVFQPLSGQLADRYGGRIVVMSGAALYSLGILGMALSPSLPVFTLFAGLVMGVAVSAAGFPVIIASLSRLLPPGQRSRAVGLGTAGSSFGQFAVVPLSALMIDGFGWQGALFGMAALSLLVLPLALPLNDRPARPDPGAAPEQTAREALSTAFRSRSFWCLFSGFFVCGLHVSFLTLHLPAFAASCHLPLYAGAGAISLIGLFNIAGSVAAGELTQRWRARELLVCIYTARGVLMAGFLLAPQDGRDAVRVRGPHGPAVAVHRAADGGARRAQLRHALAGHAVRARVRRAPDGGVRGGLAWRRDLRPHRQLRPDVGGRDPRRGVRGADPPAGERPDAAAGDGVRRYQPTPASTSTTPQTTSSAPASSVRVSASRR
jgi:predicted MFS family arabinose efflux permease